MTISTDLPDPAPNPDTSPDVAIDLTDKASSGSTIEAKPTAAITTPHTDNTGTTGAGAAQPTPLSERPAGRLGWLRQQRWPSALTPKPTTRRLGRRWLLAVLGTGYGAAAGGLFLVLVVSVSAIAVLRQQAAGGTAGLWVFFSLQLVFIGGTVTATIRSAGPWPSPLQVAGAAVERIRATIDQTVDTLEITKADRDALDEQMATELDFTAREVVALAHHGNVIIQAFYQGYISAAEPTEHDVLGGHPLPAVAPIEDPIAFVTANFADNAYQLTTLDHTVETRHLARIYHAYSPTLPTTNTNPNDPSRTNDTNGAADKNDAERGVSGQAAPLPLNRTWTLRTRTTDDTPAQITTADSHTDTDTAEGTAAIADVTTDKSEL